MLGDPWIIPIYVYPRSFAVVVFLCLLCLFAAIRIPLLFAPLRLCVRFFASSLASVLSPFRFFLQEAYRFFHRRAGNDRNVGRIMELTDYG